MEPMEKDVPSAAYRNINLLCRNALITETQTNPFRDKQHPRRLTLLLAENKSTTENQKAFLPIVVCFLTVS